MDTFIILRREGWASGEELEAAGARSKKIADEEMADDIRWIRSYALAEPNGGLGTVCVYQATSAEAIVDHAARVGMPAHEVIPVVDTMILRPDPAPVNS